MQASKAVTEILEEDQLRADLYDFLGALLAAPPDRTLLQRCKSLTGDETTLGSGIASLSKVAAVVGPRAVESEFNALFIGMGRGELLPYASYYMTGFLHERPLAILRNDMARLRIARAENVFEPEDNMASLCEMMAGLITGRFAAPADLDTQKEFFNKHIAPWADHFFSDLEGAQASVFYAAVGAIGHAFMDIEREAFRMAAGTPA